MALKNMPVATADSRKDSHITAPKRAGTGIHRVGTNIDNMAGLK